MINEENKKIIQRIINESSEIWYHGTPDAREVEKEGGFSERIESVQYIENVEEYLKFQQELASMREKDEDKYFKMLDEVPKFKKRYSYQKPVFLSNIFSVANTYADYNRAFDVQRAEAKVLKVKTNCKKVLNVQAQGMRFKSIPQEKIVNSLVSSGIDTKKAEETVKSFAIIYSNKIIRTDGVGAIASYLGFDCVDVHGVYDSYHGGNTKSTVRMVLNPKNIKIIK